MKHRPKVKKKNTRKKMEKKDSLAKNQKPTPPPKKKPNALQLRIFTWGSYVDNVCMNLKIVFTPINIKYVYETTLSMKPTKGKNT